ncbi:hypothetical protein BH11PSE12_BH11PSE12_34290 [soil metagenome]
MSISSRAPGFKKISLSLLFGFHLSAGLRPLIRYLLLLCALIFIGLPAFAQTKTERIRLDDLKPSVKVWPSLTMLADPKQSLGIQEVMRLSPLFSTPATAYGTLGLRKEAIWLHIPVEVSATSNGLWVLDIDYAPLNRIDVYVTNNETVVDQGVLGNLQPYERRLINSRAPAFGLQLKAGMRYDVYLRIENIGAMILPISIRKPSTFHASALNEQMLQGLLTGLAVCLLIYSLAQWVTLGEHLFIKYALLITGSLLFSLLQFGVGAQYLWPGNIWMELHIGGLSAFIASTGSFLFIEQALAEADSKPWFSRIMKLGACLNLFFASIFCFDWIDVETVTAIVGTLGLAPALLGLPGAIRRTRRGESVGIYFLSAWLVYFITTAILIEVIKGHLPANFWTVHSFQFGATFDMLIFMRVLGLRTKALHSAIDHARSERDSFHSLAHTDPLTGLPNRRSLNAAITSAIAHAGPEKILAVYMLDLDGFKKINDQYGHDVGDELLVSVAARLRSNLRNTDIISRLGGDEFVVASAGLHSSQQALELGEKLLKSFNYAFILSEHTCRVGLTVGYALAPFDGRDTISLLKRADAAMYAGKQGGKHCVKRSEASMALD